MRVLIGCEESGTVRQAFRDRGHDAWSCDILDASDGSPFHFKCDVLSIMDMGWDMAIFHPPCTHLAVSGARWFKDKQQEQQDALDFVRKLMACPIPRVAIENPVSIISSRIAKPTQIIQPWMFGDEATKTTCLWLKNLPKLVPTNIVGKGKRHITKRIALRSIQPARNPLVALARSSGKEMHAHLLYPVDKHPVQFT